MPKAQQLTASRNVKLVIPTNRKRSPQRVRKATTVRRERPSPVQPSQGTAEISS